MITTPSTQLATKSSGRAGAQYHPRTLSAAAFHAIFLGFSVFSFVQSPMAALAQMPGEKQVAAYVRPPITLQHLRTLTDATGIHEFAHGTIPWHENGYCAEDVGRALVAVTLYEEVTGKRDGRPLARVYLAYLQKMLRDNGDIWNREDKIVASGDSYGRILWGLGCAAGFHRDAGLASLNFLIATTFDAKGTQLSLVGNRGWFKKGGTPARFDQQPIDAAAMVEACVLAARLTGQPEFSQFASKAFEWFLGNNAKHAVLYDSQSGGCRDGLTESGPNANEGAESTIMYVIARCNLEELINDTRRK